jgi:hypothetical protein
MEQHEYIADYVDNLPTELQPEINERLKSLLRQAWINKWDSRNLSFMISRGDYSTAHSPAGAALHRLEQLVVTKPSVSGSIVAQAFTDSHCRKSGCMCSHNACYRGWIDGINHTVQVGKTYREYEATQPCPVCRQEQYDILCHTTSMAEAHIKLQERSIYNQRKKQDF